SPLYTLSLHDALPISPQHRRAERYLQHHTSYQPAPKILRALNRSDLAPWIRWLVNLRLMGIRQYQGSPLVSQPEPPCFSHHVRRSEEHTSELQSRFDL